MHRTGKDPFEVDAAIEEAGAAGAQKAIDEVAESILVWDGFGEEIARLHHAAVLSKPIADEIRKLVEDGVSQKEVAKRLKVSGYTINAIVAGKTWKD